MLNTSAMATARTISIWRSYVIAQKWQDLQVLRKIHFPSQMLGMIFFLQVIDLQQLTLSSPYMKFSDDPLGNVKQSYVCRIALSILVYLCLWLGQYILRKLVVERYVLNDVTQLIDLCCVCNISVLILSEENFGYYIHGRNVHGEADSSMHTLHMQLEGEKQDLCGSRGLLPNTDLQTFMIVLPNRFKQYYQKLKEPLVQIMTTGMRMHQSLPNVSETSKIDVRHHTYLCISKFLQTFIEHNLKELDYTMTDRVFLETVLDLELQDVSEKALFYNDHRETFVNATFYGNEFTLSTFEVLLFIFIDTFAFDFALSSVCTFLLSFKRLLFNDFMQCAWPKLEGKLVVSPKVARIMFVADPHLLGSRKGHWFDKLRRSPFLLVLYLCLLLEWQMHRTYQAAMNLLGPQVVFFLGDVFDEGMWASDREFEATVKRFHDLFPEEHGTRNIVVVGNHDIGFHYHIIPYLRHRFEDAFNTSSVSLVEVRGSYFVLINSMAMEGDHCDMCTEAMAKVQKVAAAFSCAKEGRDDCWYEDVEIRNPSPPFLLQHFPLYRESDENCTESDAAPAADKREKFRPKWECLSLQATNQLLHFLKPRAVMTGHTHHGCYRLHRPYNIPEWTLPSFSWRNKNNPSFMLMTVTPEAYAVSKCHMPQESTVITLYYLGGILYVLGCIYFQMSKKRSHSRCIKVE
ncbi:unnamed protein product [Darwinula stevensoni]|uniref:Calcineurin-like phosphoesterase domain-containing protein n=1 Tax=Darwinula stevensoni TaxID=69355 RepID=A0A7R8XCF9_9CRUS|nr:unnamed protein product [Darwinula stevensoni]CAG0892530.1 unnamed protein product [Darwinula stevensoni]